jgi:hypothetical protein
MNRNRITGGAGAEAAIDLELVAEIAIDRFRSETARKRRAALDRFFQRIRGEIGCTIGIIEGWGDVLSAEEKQSLLHRLDQLEMNLSGCEQLAVPAELANLK